MLNWNYWNTIFYIDIKFFNRKATASRGFKIVIEIADIYLQIPVEMSIKNSASILERKIENSERNIMHLRFACLDKFSRI